MFNKGTHSGVYNQPNLFVMNYYTGIFNMTVSNTQIIEHQMGNYKMNINCVLLKMWRKLPLPISRYYPGICL